MTEEEHQENLRYKIVDLYNEVKSIKQTVQNCARRFGQLGWDENAADAKAEEALAELETADTGALEDHRNALREVLTSAADVLSQYQVQTDQMPGRGGISGIVVRSGINRANITLERTTE